MLLSHPVTFSAPPATPCFKLTLGTLDSSSLWLRIDVLWERQLSLLCFQLWLTLKQQIIIALTIHGGLILNDCFRDEPFTQFWSFRACWIYSSLTRTHTKTRAFILYLVIICESHLETRGRTSLEHKPKLKRGEWKNERNFSFDDTTEAPT